MPIVQTLPNRTYRTAVTLAYYAHMVGYDECSINGVYNVNTYDDDECRGIWTLPQRQYILKYFSEAQEELEQEMKILLQPTWIVGSVTESKNAKYADVTNCRVAYNPKWLNFIQMGRRYVNELEYDAIVDHTSDPAIITITNIDLALVTDVNFVRVYYPDTEIEIDPNSITISGTTMTIEVPRCRMVRFDLRDNNDSGVDYTDTTLFQQTVDVIYLSTEDVNSIVKFDDETVGLYYLAGEIIPTVQQLDMIIKLAHAKMPEEPCGCAVAKRLWEADHIIPEFITQKREMCPFGLNNGAFDAWDWAMTMKKHRFGYI